VTAVRPSPFRAALIGAATIAVMVLPAPAADDALPPGVLRAIATLAPTTVPVDRIDISGEDCALDGAAHPARVRGDFDGNGVEDWALHLRSARPIGTRVTGGRAWTMYVHRFVMLLGRRDGGFEAVTINLGEHSLPFGLMLELQPPGPVKEVEGGDDRRVVLRNPGVIEIYCGKAASTYYWDARTRRVDSLVTGD
jgi:hypothetical protein